MNCIDQNELEQFLKGKLPVERMLEVDSHVRECAECRTLATSMPAQLSARVRFGTELTGAADCPEYEQLSAYVGESLDVDAARAIRVHSNLCECCANDLDRIRELRSHAALRGKIVVQPGLSGAPRRSLLYYWKQTLAVVSVAGLVTIAFVYGNFGGPIAKNPARVAIKPPVAPVIAPKSPQNNQPRPAPGSVAVTPTAKPPIHVAFNPRPPLVVPPPVLRDGGYTVIRKGGALRLSKGDGSSVASKLGARMAASIEEKLRTGKIQLPRLAVIKFAEIGVRDGNADYSVPPSAPKPIAPMGKVVMNARPTFDWAAVDLAASYRVRVYDTAGSLVAEQKTTKTSLTLSKPLARGKVYHWRVGVRFGETDQWSQSALVGFGVLSADDLASIGRVRSRLPGSHLAMGVAYESAGLYDEAASEYRALRRANPGSKLAQKLLYGAAQH